MAPTGVDAAEAAPAGGGGTGGGGGGGSREGATDGGRRGAGGAGGGAVSVQVTDAKAVQQPFALAAQVVSLTQVVRLPRM